MDYFKFYGVYGFMIWYNVVRHYTGADLQSDQREEYFHGKSCASPGGNMDEGNCRGMEGDIKTSGEDNFAWR